MVNNPIIITPINLKHDGDADDDFLLKVKNDFNARADYASKLFSEIADNGYVLNYIVPNDISLELITSVEDIENINILNLPSINNQIRFYRFPEG